MYVYIHFFSLKKKELYQLHAHRSALISPGILLSDLIRRGRVSNPISIDTPKKKTCFKLIWVGFKHSFGE